MDITEKQMELILPDTFDNRFEQERLDYETDKACFHALNQEYKAAFGRKRYKNWNSYKVTRWKRVKS